MSKYDIKLLKREPVAEGTMEFFFEKPAGFTFGAGQYVDLTLANPPETDAEGNIRTFSITSAPDEPHIAIATRLRDSAFKRVLSKGPLGLEIELEGPFGSFTLHANASRPAVFLAGGIGITPVRSIVVSAAHEHKPHTLFLFYSNRRPEDAAFLGELDALQNENKNFTFIPTMTDMPHSQTSWSGETGYITKEMIAQYMPNPKDAVYYLVGPAPMVAAMRKVLDEMMVDPDSIKTEEFTGY